ncbi:hypothetical protein [Sphingomonas lenta]|uniref:Uncharacterized protein n=1 Tax=Sphingomonas lenta TaxID=1141887 RepID=A0A2A2SHW9_9SPHN|nr:hypothetical protein [Sphingomonas lenta]PAX08832.1 hypothetical protein CKY28_05605 [Sphingomonas lenta]
MLTTIALLAGVQAAGVQAPIAEPAVQEEITVIGRKLRDWRGSLKTRNGTVRCVTRKSTGDREVDQIGCDAMVTCFPRFEGEFKAVLSTTRDKAVRNRVNTEISRRLATCVEQRHDELVETLADRRAARRS